MTDTRTRESPNDSPHETLAAAEARAADAEARLQVAETKNATLISAAQGVLRLRAKTRSGVTVPEADRTKAYRALRAAIDTTTPGTRIEHHPGDPACRGRLPSDPVDDISCLACSKS